VSSIKHFQDRCRSGIPRAHGLTTAVGPQSIPTLASSRHAVMTTTRQCRATPMQPAPPCPTYPHAARSGGSRKSLRASTEPWRTMPRPEPSQARRHFSSADGTPGHVPSSWSGQDQKPIRVRPISRRPDPHNFPEVARPTAPSPTAPSMDNFTEVARSSTPKTGNFIEVAQILVARRAWLSRVRHSEALLTRSWNDHPAIGSPEFQDRPTQPDLGASTVPERRSRTKIARSGLRITSPPPRPDRPASRPGRLERQHPPQN
jgi:hypothetical protein